MKDQDKFQTEVTEALAKLQEKYEATHDDLVKIVGYSLSSIKYPAPLSEGTLTPKGEVERQEKLAKDEKKPSNPIVRPPEKPAFLQTTGKQPSQPSNPVIK